MTKKERDACDSLIRGITRHKNRKFIDATKYNKRYKKPGRQLVILSMKDILNEWHKFYNKVKK